MNFTATLGDNFLLDHDLGFHSKEAFILILKKIITFNDPHRK